MRTVVGHHDVLWITLDTLRYDVACDRLAAGGTPNLAAHLPGGAWERRHAPGSFTYASHAAMFAGFFPTPARPGPHPRALGLTFPGSTSLATDAVVFDAPDLVHGFAARGYHTICIGGTGFFNLQNPLGRVLPGLFAEAHWSPELGVTHPESPRHQVDLALRAVAGCEADQRVLLFVNVSAMHQPNCIFAHGATEDSPATQGAALDAVDRELGRLFSGLRARGRWHCVVTSDHGTCYGEDGFVGHRLAHEVVWTVPYAEFPL